MIVRAIKKQRQECPEKIKSLILETGAFLTIGEEYEVHAITVFDGLTLVQTVDDLGYPAWFPSILFEIVNGTLPHDWKCNFFPQNGCTGISLVFGPEFISLNQDAYQAMVELDANQVDLFWKRIDALSQSDEA